MRRSATVRNLLYPLSHRATAHMRRTAFSVMMLFLLVCNSVLGSPVLQVDFNSNQDGGGDSSASPDPSLSPAAHNQEGWSSYHANHESAAEFTTADYGGITVTPIWPNTTDNRVRQSIDRGADNDANWDNSQGYLNLITDWIGIDTRTGSGGNGDWDGISGTPTYMDLVLGGLLAGEYEWTSFHHDTEHIHGPFAVWLSTDGGTAFVQLPDGVMTDSTPGGTPDSGATEAGPDPYALSSTYTTSFVADGTNDVILRFAPYAQAEVHRQIWGMNGFLIEAANPCLNASPSIQGPELLVTTPRQAVTIDITVTDDGKPYVEGCDPAHPDAGTPYPMQYLWTQQSGPAPVAFEPAADVEDPVVRFTLPGTYELLLRVSDGPVGEAPEEAKVSEFGVTVEAVRPLDGDIDHNGIVDLDDLHLLAGHWLDMAGCPEEESHCADLNDSGSVTAEDMAVLASNWQVESSRVVINEFLASNREGLLDGDGNSSDWIELYNSDARPVSLQGWFLTDNPDRLEKWPFPAQAVLGAGEYMVVFASDQPVDDYVDSSGYLHANFAMDKDGEYLALVGPGGRIVHEYSPSFPTQEVDISYGIWHSLYRYFAVPTPGEANQQAFVGFTARTSHSLERGFYDEPFLLDLFTETPDAFIRYTLDGSEPTEQYGLVYDPQTPVLIAETTTVRSIAVKPGYEPGDVSTHTYIFVDEVAGQPAHPSGWPGDWGYSSDASAVVPADYEMDPRVVENTLDGYSIRDALLDIPTVSISMAPDDFISDASGIYANPLSRWERKCSVEYILPDGSEGFQHDCKVEVHGNASRRPYRMQKHSLRLTFTSLYGPSKLEYPLFPESNVEEFNQLVLRASFTDSWGLVSWQDSRYRPNDSQYIRDVWMKESLRDMGQPSSYGNFVHLYVNGLYFGLHNLTERIREEFFADHLGGEPEDWEINEDLSSPGPRWNAMMSVDPSTPAGYLAMQEYLDVVNFADYMLLHFYADAEDWPHHNGYAAANPVGGDGRFRFLVWDQEIVLDHHGRAASRIDSTGGAGSVFQKMRTSEEFRLLFADRVYKHCFHDGALSLPASQDRYSRIADEIDKAIVAESARWGDTQISTPYGNAVGQPNPLDDINHDLYPPAPHGPDYYFTREDSWVVERDNILQNYLPAIHDLSNSYALLNVLRAENLYPGVDPPEFRIDGIARHGGHVETGAMLAMAAASGDSYAEVELVAEGAPVRVHVPTDDRLSLSWTQPSFVPGAGWSDGSTTGVGYDAGSGYEVWIGTDMQASMYGSGKSNSVLCRIEFAYDGSLDIIGLELLMKYDDGFVAYLNGVEIARSPSVIDATPGSARTGSHEADASYESFDVSAHRARLVAGTNVLAIHGINTASTSTDLLILPRLVAQIPDEGGASSPIWYTMDGSDPRLPGGAVNPAASQYAAPIPLLSSVLIKARTLIHGEWSALNETVYAVGPVRDSLRITELMYHPADPNGEYVELLNIGDEAINLNRVRFTAGLDFAFGSVDLAPGAYILLVQDEQEFRRLHPQFQGVIVGEYSGRLDNAGETICLRDAADDIIQEFHYQDDWHWTTDGEGFSLTARDPRSTEPGVWSQASGWRPSAAVGGSPGYDDTGGISTR